MGPQIHSILKRIKCNELQKINDSGNKTGFITAGLREEGKYHVLSDFGALALVKLGRAIMGFVTSLHVY
jgi:hypothetical protein